LAVGWGRKPFRCRDEELKLCEVILKSQAEVRSEESNHVVHNPPGNWGVLGGDPLKLGKEISVERRLAVGRKAEIRSSGRAGAK
jgi:hypothetical protein